MSESYHLCKRSKTNWLLFYILLNLHLMGLFLQIFEIVNLADELLPPLPQGTISLPQCSSFLMKGSAAKKSSTSSSGKEEDTNGTMHEISAREKLLQDQPELLQQFGMDLLPVLIQVCASWGINRFKCEQFYCLSWFFPNHLPDGRYYGWEMQRNLMEWKSF